MAYAPSVFVKWRYVDDQGNQLVYKILQHIILQTQTGGAVKIGGVIATGTEGRPSASFKPRTVLLWNATNKLARRVICFAHDAPLYAGTSPEGENTLQLYAGRPSELVTFTAYGYEGERLRGERPSA